MKNYYFRIALMLAVFVAIFSFQSCKKEIVVPETAKIVEVNGIQMPFVWVNGGSFYLGAQCTDPAGKNYTEQCLPTEGPVSERNISGFYLGLTEVTQDVWISVMGNNPSKFVGDKRPVESVTFSEVLTFISRLNAATNKVFRLPTEAEWEFAARGGAKELTNLYSGSSDIEAVAWYYDNACALGVADDNYGTHEVGTKEPNELGFYDMTGNVKEWCNSPFALYNTVDSIANQSIYKVIRGGSWSSYSEMSRVTSRGFDTPGNKYADYGLRLILQ